MYNKYMQLCIITYVIYHKLCSLHFFVRLIYYMLFVVTNNYKFETLKYLLNIFEGKYGY